MFTDVTYQDWLAAADRDRLLLTAIDRYKASRDFRQALEAGDYFRGCNAAVARKTILRARKIETRDASGRKRIRAGTEDVVGNRIGSGFLFRFITQQNQFLLANGCILRDSETKARLGADFDHQLAALGERALIHGVSWGFWNADHLEVLEAARDMRSGFFALLDELTDQPMVGVQFWQLTADKPLYIRLFEMDGVELTFDQEALQTVAQMAIERKTGARGLRAILEAAMLDIMFEIPSCGDIKQCRITKDVIKNGERPVLERGEGQKSLEAPKPDVSAS